MSLDVTTLFVALFFAFALFGASLTFARPALLQSAELTLWAWSTWALVAGFLMLSSRLVWSEWISILFGNGLVFVSLFMAGQALYQFILHRDAPRWQLGLMLGAWVCTLLVLKSPVSVRIAVISALLAAQVLPLSILVFTRGWHAEVSLRTVGITFALTTAALTMRVFDALLWPSDFASYFQASFGNGVTYLAAFLFPLGAGFGFVLANLERIALRLDKLATYDSLTGCLNRGAFDAMLGHAMAQARRGKVPISLVVVDLDHFKQINDAHGHQTGDAVLREFVRCLHSRLRAGDMLGRIGGDEFAVVLSDTDAPGAVQLAEELRSTCNGLQIELLTKQRISISIGVSTAIAGSDVTVEKLYSEADQALYTAKARGRNRSEHFQPNTRETSSG